MECLGNYQEANAPVCNITVEDWVVVLNTV